MELTVRSQSGEELLSSLGVLCFIAWTAHSAFEKTPRNRCKSMMNYAIDLAGQRGYSKSEHLRQLFRQPDTKLITNEIEELAQYVNKLDIFEHFRINIISVKDGEYESSL